MFIAIVGFKGGVGKTTAAIHLAGYYQSLGRSVKVIDADPNRSAVRWFKRGATLDFSVCDAMSASMLPPSDLSIIDSAARPSRDDLESLKQCVAMILPTTPDTLGIEGLAQTIATLQDLDYPNYWVLPNICPPRPSTATPVTLDWLHSRNIPCLPPIRRFQAYIHASAKGTLVRDSGDRYGKIAWSDYCNVGAQLTKGALS